MYFIYLSCLLNLATSQASSQPPASAPVYSNFHAFIPNADLDLTGLNKLVSEHSVELQAQLYPIDDAYGAFQASSVMVNPSLLLQVGNIPLSTTNPAGLRAGDQVMNYGGGLAYHLEINKRNFRQNALKAQVKGLKANWLRQARLQALQLSKLLAEIAYGQLKNEHAQGMLNDLAASKSASTDWAAALAIQTLEAQIDSAQAAIQQALRDCTTIIAKPCQVFTQTADAKRYLERWSQLPAGSNFNELEKRTDIVAIENFKLMAQEEVKFAKAKWIPDPDIRVEYVHDRLKTAGHQMHTLQIGLAVPIPLFDRGQIDKQRATIKLQRLEQEKQKVLKQAQAQIELLTQQLVQLQTQTQAVQQKLSAQGKDAPDTSARHLHTQYGKYLLLVKQAELLKASARIVCELLAHKN